MLRMKVIKKTLTIMISVEEEKCVDDNRKMC